MRLNRQVLDTQEPIGIVIADGGLPEASTRFSAFVWGPVPDEPEVVPVPPARDLSKLVAAL